MDQTHLTVTICSHHFSVNQLSIRGRELCMAFARTLIQYGLERLPGGRFHRAAQRVFAAATQNKNEFRFHINSLKEFKEHLQRHNSLNSLVVWKVLPPVDAERVELKIRDGWVPREKQIPGIEFMAAPEPISKLYELQTGSGKTFSALYAISKVGVRLIIIVRPMYMQKWVQDLLKTYELTPEDILFVQGGEHLQALLEIAKNGMIKEKVIILSNKTYQNWLKLYEQYGHDIEDLGYAVPPQQLFEITKSGERLIDEVHQDFHLNFLVDLYTHTNGSISLSATLISRDAFLKRMYELAYPKSSRAPVPALHKYIDVYAVHYRFFNPQKLRTQDFSGRGYSHITLEKCILRHEPTKRNYFKLIHDLIESTFTTVKREKKRLAVFAASVDMCTALTEHFAKIYPHLSVKRYAGTAGDPYENLIESDIRFTTLQSGGTAHDIPDLVTAILTIAVDSIQANIQTLGRLRYLPDCETKFYYLVCDDFPKHIEYHKRKCDWAKERAKSFHEVNSGYVI